MHAHAHVMPYWLAMSGHRGHRGRPHRRPHGGQGFGPPFGPGFGRGPRARRGDVRAALLVLLAEEPRNGYGLMQEIERRSDGVWRPSPGSVYPALQQLEDEELVRSEESDGRRVFALTDAGRAHVEENREAFGEPWADLGVGAATIEMRDLLWQAGAAAMQVMHSGNEAQIARAQEVLAETRRSLYRILADDEAGAAEPEGGSA